TLEPEYTAEDIIKLSDDITTLEKDFIRTMNPTPAEDIFEEIFAEALGFDKREYLNFQYPVKMNGQSLAYIDYYLETSIGPVAFEVNGETFHNPIYTGKDAYLKQIKRQNFIVSSGIKVFRWTTRQLQEQREEVVIFLRELFKDVEFFRKEELFEKNPVCFIDDWSHQEEALQSLEEIRSLGLKAALVTQATGTGKTVIAVKDASKLGGRTLFIAHTIELLSQAESQFQKHWPEGYSSGKIYCSTIQSMVGKIRQFPRDYFDYIIIDEAHHGAARTYRYLIEYFDPKFLLGLTATPDRMDRQSLEEIFGRIAHSLDLKTAIEQGKLVPIRALRVNTNISFDKIRINRYDYTKKDLEKNLIVEDRDGIILETYMNYIHGTGRKTVIFCVSVPHAQRIAGLMRDNGINAEIVHGSMNKKDRERVLKEYEYGSVNVLTSCSVLNEGWDSPVTSVLFMARPTMSKVLYMQQLGRGVRKYRIEKPSMMVAERRASYGVTVDMERIKSALMEKEQIYNKESLLVVDFVDNFMNMDPSWSVHAVFGLNHFRPGDYVCCPDNMKNMKIQPDFIQNLDLNLWIKSLEEIDPFTFEQKTEDMISSVELARELWTGDDTLLDYIKKGKIKPDKILQISGGRKLYFFKKDNIENIRQELGLKKRGIDTIKEDFFEFLEDRVYTFSFKIVFLRSFLMHVNKKGIANIDSVLNSYMAFFLYLYNNHIKVETEKSPYNNYDYLTDKSKMKKSLLINPFEKFERRRLVNYCKDLAEIGFNNILWKQLEKDDLNRIMKQMEEDLIKYYKDRLDTDLPAHVINYFKEG
ncbi:MAG: DEAD/DEAH box helicase, partial [Candidatus Eremiobacterota bacterium]